VVAALAAARELPQLSLEDALELTLLVARKDPRRHPRVAARCSHSLTDYEPERVSGETPGTPNASAPESSIRRPSHGRQRTHSA
jgi:hypothetical protein